MPDKHYTDWKPLDAARAQQAICRGAEVFSLDVSFYRGGASYGHGLKTKRGACYVISNFVMRGIVLPAEQ